MTHLTHEWGRRPIGLIVLDRIRAWWDGLNTPDPWDEEEDEAVREPRATPVCHHCFHPVSTTSAFCPNCTSAVGSTNNLHPYWRIFSIGEVARSGLSENANFRPLTVLGYIAFGICQFGFFAPAYFYRLLRNYLRIRRRRAQFSPS